MARKNVTPIYLEIAVDVAGRIVREELRMGQKISGRSTLASEYNVSPETIRKAMKLLSDMHVITVKHGNGIHVSSIERAEEFIEEYKIKTSVNELKEDLIALMKQRKTIEYRMNQTVNSIIDYTSRFKNCDYVSVNEYYMDFEDRNIAKSLLELDLKKNTGVTLVGIRRDGLTMLSPDDHEVVKVQDRLLYVGVPSSSVRLGEYLRSIYDF